MDASGVEEAGASVQVAEQQDGAKAREPHAMVATRTYLPKAALEYTVHKLPGMLTRTLAEWGKTTISTALQARGVPEADLAEQIKAVSAQTLGVRAEGPSFRPSFLPSFLPSFRSIAPSARR